MNIGLALGSGGAKGFAHIPYLQVIDELGIKLKCILRKQYGRFNRSLLCRWDVSSGNT